MSNTHKIVLHDDDLHKLKKHRFLRLGKNLLILDENIVHQVKVYGRVES